MSLFVCDECGVVDNTALTLYWLRGRLNASNNGRALCSQCDPAIGKWHGAFPREQYDPTKNTVLNRESA